MSDTDQRIESAVQMLERDTQLTHDIVHGDKDSVVQTEGGPVPSHNKVAADGYQYFVDELRPRVADINQHAKLVTDSASEANGARNEAVKAKNDAVKVVYDGDASLDPAPGKIPVADSEGNIHHGFLPDQSIPFPDFWLPLNDSLQILAGEGKHDQVDVSDAQDGSEMVDLPTKSAEFSRATTATYVDKSGVLRTARVNEPRFEKEGILIEGGSTNLIETSHSNNSWNHWGTPTHGTKQQGENFFGQPSAIITYDPPEGSTSLGSSSRIVSQSVETSDTYTVSVWLKVTSGATGLWLYFTGGSGSDDYVNLNIPANGKWTRYSVTLKASRDHTAVNLQVRPTTSKTSYITEIACPQIEKLPFASSYIPTDGSPVTRAMDVLTFDSKNILNSKQSMSVSADVSSNLESFHVDRYVYGFGNGAIDTESERLTHIAGTNTRYSAYKIRGDSIPNKKTTYRVATFRKAGLLKQFQNGELIMSKSGTTNDYTPQAARIGNRVSGTDHSLFGHIRNFRIWHKELSDEQIAALGAAK